MAADESIIEKTLAGSSQGWSELVASHAPAVRAVVRLVFDCYREPVGPADIDEVVLEVFERAASDRFQWLTALRTASMLGPSLRVLAAWRTLGLLRAKYRVFTCSLEAEVKLAGHHVATAVLARPPEKERAPHVTRADVDQLVAEFLKEVGDRPTRILTGLYAENLAYAEIAKQEGMPMTSTAQTIFEERRRLAERLAKAAPEAEL